MISLGTPQLLCPLLGQFLDAPYTVCHRFPARLSPGYPQQSPAQGPTLNSLPLPRHTPYSRTLPPCITAHRNTCTDCSVVKTPSSQGRRHGFDPWSGNWIPTKSLYATTKTGLVKLKKVGGGRDRDLRDINEM